jgi:hypothetical protein
VVTLEWLLSIGLFYIYGIMISDLEKYCCIWIDHTIEDTEVSIDRDTRVPGKWWSERMIAECRMMWIFYKELDHLSCERFLFSCEFRISFRITSFDYEFHVVR